LYAFGTQKPSAKSVQIEKPYFRTLYAFGGRLLKLMACARGRTTQREPAVEQHAYMSEDDGQPIRREEALVSEALLLMSSSSPSRARTAALRSSLAAPVVSASTDSVRKLACQLVLERQGTTTPLLNVPQPNDGEPEPLPCAQQLLPADPHDHSGFLAGTRHVMQSATGAMTASPSQWAAHGTPNGEMTTHNPADAATQWSAAEDQIMTEAVKRFGCKWSLISAFVPGRSPASVRNRWHRMQRAARHCAVPGDSPESTESDATMGGATRSLYQCSRVRERVPPCASRTFLASRLPSARIRTLLIAYPFALPLCLCAQCGMPKRGHSCMLTPGDAGQVLSACEVMNTIACEYGTSAAAAALSPMQ
jgi:hypothetical protein